MVGRKKEVNIQRCQVEELEIKEIALFILRNILNLQEKEELEKMRFSIAFTDVSAMY